VAAQVEERNGTATVTVAVAGRRAVAGSAEADAALSRHLGRSVRLTQVVPEQAMLHRQLPDDEGLVPEWMSDATAGQEMITEVSGAQPGGRFVDFGAVHLVTTGALERLARQLGRARPSRHRGSDPTSLSTRRGTPSLAKSYGSGTSSCRSSSPPHVASSQG